MHWTSTTSETQNPIGILRYPYWDIVASQGGVFTDNDLKDCAYGTQGKLKTG